MNEYERGWVDGLKLAVKMLTDLGEPSAAVKVNVLASRFSRPTQADIDAAKVLELFIENGLENE